MYLYRILTEAVLKYSLLKVLNLEIHKNLSGFLYFKYLDRVSRQNLYSILLNWKPLSACDSQAPWTRKNPALLGIFQTRDSNFLILNWIAYEGKIKPFFRGCAIFAIIYLSILFKISRLNFRVLVIKTLCLYYFLKKSQVAMIECK